MGGYDVQVPARWNQEHFVTSAMQPLSVPSRRIEMEQRLVLSTRLLGV